MNAVGVFLKHGNIFVTYKTDPYTGVPFYYININEIASVDSINITAGKCVKLIIPSNG